MTKDSITVYATTWCPFCKKLLAGLRSQSIPFALVDVDENEEAGKWVESVNNGNRVVPTVYYSDGSHSTNPPIKQVVAKYQELIGR
jgi:hypothetical protein